MTIVELVVAVAIMVLVTVAFVSFAQGARSYAGQSGVQQFDAALAYAQSVAANSGNGATLVFAPSGDGFVLTVYSGRPTSANALSESSIVPVRGTSSVSEAQLGAPPFTVFLNGAGHASASHGAVGPGSVIANDPGCPAGETSVTLKFSDPRTNVTRSLSCRSVP